MLIVSSPCIFPISSRDSGYRCSSARGSGASCLRNASRDLAKPRNNKTLIYQRIFTSVQVDSHEFKQSFLNISRGEQCKFLELDVDNLSRIDLMEWREAGAELKTKIDIIGYIDLEGAESPVKVLIWMTHGFLQLLVILDS